MKFTTFRALRNALLILGLLASTGAMAQSVQAGTLRISDAWARATVAKQAHGAAYLQIENAGKAADKLLRASSSVARAVELHSMSMDHDVMRMRQLDDITVPAGGKVKMTPGNGAHLMLLDLKQPLQAGQTVNLLLEFEKAGKVAVVAKVLALNATH